ncbi:MAG: FtsX-like permease family protein [Gemmatimonadales bacterium]|nr:MAG: FtsX-like permease family protein [Gemmatimonadales bacterium]
MTDLVARATRRHLLRHPWQLVLTLLGVSLGVAVTVALDLAIQSSREAFRVSGETITGRATHQVLAGPAGLPDGLAARLRIEGGLRDVAPVVEGWGVHPDQPERPLRILGVDPFSEAPFRPWLGGGPTGEVDGARLVTEAGAVFLSEGTALSLGVAAGDPLPLRIGGTQPTLRVAGVLEPTDALARQGLRDLLVVDLSEAQDLLGSPGRVDRLDLRIPERISASPEAEAALLALIESLLPGDARLVPAGTREETMGEMVRAFDLNLTALSLLGLLFGVFLIYNTMTFSVVQRRRLFGTLRALGATRRRILAGVLGEAMALGVAGAVLGVGLGIVLGRGLVRLVTRTINDLYFVVSVEGLALPPDVLIRGALLGIGATLLASLPPAWEATTVSAREAMARSTVESRVREMVPKAALLGALMVAAGAGLLLLTSRSLGAAFGGLFAVLTGMALIVPAATVLLLAAVRPVLARVAGVLGAMAARGVVTSLSRTAPALASLVIAVSVVVGLGIMIQSFRGSVVRWLDVTLQADLYISPPGVVANRPEGRLPVALAASAAELPGVAGVSTYLGTELVTESYGVTRFVALGLDPRGERSLDLMEGGDAEGQVFQRFRAGDGVFVSEPFAFRHGVGVGDPVVLPASDPASREAGGGTLPVLAIFRDYGSEAGTVMIARPAWDVLLGDAADDRVTSLGLFLDPGVADDPEAVARIEAGLRGAAGAPLEIRSNRELRALTLEVFDRTFEVTRVLRLLAFVVAFIAVLSALMALELERSRELGVLRATGMTPGQTWGLVTAQTGIMGVVSGLFALPVGVALAAVMIHVVNRRSFGWSLDMEVGLALPLQAVALAVTGAVLAGIYPSWKMSRTPPSAALRGE